MPRLPDLRIFYTVYFIIRGREVRYGRSWNNLACNNSQSLKELCRLLRPGTFIPNVSDLAGSPSFPTLFCRMQFREKSFTFAPALLFCDLYLVQFLLASLLQPLALSFHSSISLLHAFSRRWPWLVSGSTTSLIWSAGSIKVFSALERCRASTVQLHILSLTDRERHFL